MTEDIKKYRVLMEQAYTHEHMITEAHDPAQVAELVRHVFGASAVDKHTLRDALLGHKNDPAWAMEVLTHLSK